MRRRLGVGDRLFGGGFRGFGATYVQGVLGHQKGCATEGGQEGTEVGSWGSDSRSHFNSLRTPLISRSGFPYRDSGASAGSALADTSRALGFCRRGFRPTPGVFTPKT